MYLVDVWGGGGVMGGGNHSSYVHCLPRIFFTRQFLRRWGLWILFIK